MTPGPRLETQPKPQPPPAIVSAGGRLTLNAWVERLASDLASSTPPSSQRLAHMMISHPARLVRALDRHNVPNERTLGAAVAQAIMQPRVFAHLAKDTALNEAVEPARSRVSSPGLCAAAGQLLQLSTFTPSVSQLELKLALAVPGGVNADLRQATIQGAFGRTLNLGAAPRNLPALDDSQSYYLKLPKRDAKPEELRVELQAMIAFGEVLRELEVPRPTPVGLLAREHWPAGEHPANVDPQANTALLYRAPPAYNDYIYRATSASEASLAAVKYARFVGHLAARGFLVDPKGVYFHNEDDSRAFSALLPALSRVELGRTHDVWEPLNTPNIGRGGPRDLKHYAHLPAADVKGSVLRDAAASSCGDALFYGYLCLARWFKENDAFANHAAYAAGLHSMTLAFAEEFTQASPGSVEHRAITACLRALDWNTAAAQAFVFLSGDYVSLMKGGSIRSVARYYERGTTVRFVPNPDFAPWERTAGRPDLGGFNLQNPLTGIARIINLTVPAAFLWREALRVG